MSLADRIAAPLRRRLAARFQRLEAKPLWRLVLVLLLSSLAAVLAVACRLGLRDANAFDAAVRLVFALLAMGWLGRALRLRVEASVAASPPAFLRDPVFDMLLGLLSGTTLLFFVSFFLKRIFGLHEPIGVAFPVGLLGVAALLSLGKGATARLVPHAGERLPLFLFFAGLCWLVGPHWQGLHPYSSDPAQHIAWLTQLQLFGFVPDHYFQSGAPITYPLGFHALLYVLGGLSGLQASLLVAIAPALASGFLVQLSLQVGRGLFAGGTRSQGDAILFSAAFLALATSLHGAQFSVWNVYEGTGRLALGFVHAVPLLLIAVFAGAVRVPGPARDEGSGARGDEARGGGFGISAASVGALVVSAALVFATNPSHLPLHAVLCGAALSLGLARGQVGGGAAAAGILAGIVLSASLLSADAASAERLGWLERSDPELLKVQSEFDGSLDAPTCKTLACMGDALFRGESAVAFLAPLRNLVEGPVRAVLRRVAGNAFDTRAVPWEHGPRNYPDWTGVGVAPLHGPADFFFVLLTLLAGVVGWRSWRAARAGQGAATLGPLFCAFVVLLLACCLDAVGRSAMRAWVHPDDAALRLLPDYAHRASALFFAQTLWPLLAAGVIFGGARHRALRALGVAVLLLFFFAAERDLRTRQAPLATRFNGAEMPTRADVADLRALEAEVIPAGEHYLVSAHSALSNRERWLVVIDPSLPIYLQASRPALFLYHLSTGARVSAAALEETCGRLRRGEVAPLLQRYGARWVALSASSEEAGWRHFGARRFCGRPFSALFPDAQLRQLRGRTLLFRLW